MPGKGEIMGRWMKKIKNKQYGQAMVEFALTLPIFLLAVLGVIELSRFFLVYSSVYTASREAARFGSSVGDEGVPNYMNCDGIRQMAVDMGWFGGIIADNVDVYYESRIDELPIACPQNVDLGYRVVVEVTSVYQPLTGILPEIPITARNGRTIMKEIGMVATPIPLPICKNDIKFEGGLGYPQTNDKLTLVINIMNISPYSTYRITSISNLSWEDELDPSKRKNLLFVKWNGNVIWDKANSGGVSTPLTITSNDWDPGLRNLPAGQIFELRFEFDKNMEKAKDTVKFKLDFTSPRPGVIDCYLVWPSSP